MSKIILCLFKSYVKECFIAVDFGKVTIVGDLVSKVKFSPPFSFQL